MSQPLAKLVAILLLFVQSLVVFAPGQVLCIPLRDCGTHEQPSHTACGHFVPDGFNVDQIDDSCLDHEHGPCDWAIHPDDKCGCHLHVALPDSEQLPSNSRGDNAELRSLLVPVLVAIVLTRDLEPEVVVVERFSPPDFSVADQVLGLRATRLLI